MKVNYKIVVVTCALVLSSSIFAADIGVIPDKKCPANSKSISIYMDDEDNNNASKRTGWRGAIYGSTVFQFCRIDGDAFKPLSNGEDYAVLKLSDSCPNNSIEFDRYFDNEDNRNNNQSTGNIYPNIVGHNTHLKFCYFKGTNHGMDSFPNIGVEYGVFAPRNFSKSLASGTIFTDDEDKNNANKLNVHGHSAIKAIIHGGVNTTLYVHKVETQGGVTSLSILSSRVEKIDQNSLYIYFKLNQNAQAQVEYGTTTQYGQFTTKETSFNYASHRQKISNLDTNTLYHYRIHAFDEDGNEIVSNDATFHLDKALKYPPLGTLEKRFSKNDGLTIPTVGNPSIDNVFKTKTYKVAKSNNSIVGYPKTQSWNKDMSLIRVGYRLYNANTLKESPLTKGLPDHGSGNAYAKLCSPNDFRWSNKEANTFFAINPRREFIRGRITNNMITCNVVESFKNEYEIVKMGPYEGNIDNNDRYVVLTLKKPNDSQVYIMLYDILHDKRKWTKKLSDKIWKSDNPTFDWISISQSGKYILVNYAYKEGGVYLYDGLTRYDINFHNGVELKYATNKPSQGAHGDVGYDINGHEVFVAFVAGWGVVSYDLDNPHQIAKSLTNSPYGGGHVSCRNTDRPGWCYVTTKSEGNKRVFALKIDGTRETVQNFSQTHNRGSYPENYGAPSPDGTKVIFNSHWDSGSIGTFVTEVQ